MSDSLESVLLLARQATGKALVSLIRQSLASPAITSYSDLLEADNVRRLSETDDAQVVTLLRLFSYGTYEDFKQNQSSLPALNEAELYKLKKLSLVSIASESHEIPYTTLLSKLDLPSTRALEDLIIDAIYSSLLKAKLNTRSQLVYVESTAGRDLDPERSLDRMVAALDAWSETCDAVLLEIQGAIEAARGASQARARQQADHQRAIEEVQRRVAGLQNDGNPQAGNHASRGKRPASAAAAGGQPPEDVSMEDDAGPAAGTSRTRGTDDVETGSASGPGLGRKRKVPTKTRR